MYILIVNCKLFVINLYLNLTFQSRVLIILCITLSTNFSYYFTIYMNVKLIVF